MATRSFASHLDALAEVFAFSAAGFAREGIELALLPTVDVCLEELFTNLVKYGRSAAPIQIELRGIEGGVEVSLVAEDVDDFDPTRGPAVDTTLALEQRQPGGLGLHLVRRLVDSIEYEYQDTPRRSRVTFRKTQA